MGFRDCYATQNDKGRVTVLLRLRLAMTSTMDSRDKPENDKNPTPNNPMTHTITRTVYHTYGFLSSIFERGLAGAEVAAAKYGEGND